MSYYFIAQIRINDETEYQKYINKSSEVLNKYKGRYLAVELPARIADIWYL